MMNYSKPLSGLLIGNAVSKEVKATTKGASALEHRCEPRYSCLGIGLMYSLNLNANLENVGTDIYQAQLYDMSLNGLSIDVHHDCEIGKIFRICIEAPHGQRETLEAKVKWKKRLHDDTYRLGLVILAYTGTAEACIQSVTEGCYQQQKQTVPSEIRLSCLSCEQRVLFEYQGEQEGISGKNSRMSLYNCPACGTTRSIATILQYNRQR